VSQEQVPRPERGLSPGLVRLMTVTCAVTLAPDEQRSRVIGTLMSGLLIGILLSRTFAGVIAQVAGWRAVYGAAAGAMALTTVALRGALPDHPRELSVSYRQQMRGVLATARSEPVLRWRSLIGAAVFAAFGCFWTTVTFLLSGEQYGFSQLGIGLFALVGVAGAATASFGGRSLDAPGASLGRHRRRPGAHGRLLRADWAGRHAARRLGPRPAHVRGGWPGRRLGQPGRRGRARSKPTRRACPG
jgi:predicted MFS family arabinose efflux permease